MINSATSLLYVVDYTPFEKQSWFLLRLAQQATYDNLLCFVKSVSASKSPHTPVTPKLVEWQEGSFKRTDARVHLTRWYSRSFR